MKYIRVILAVEDNKYYEAYAEIDEYIEDSDFIKGAYISGAYEYRDDALHGEWRETN